VPACWNASLERSVKVASRGQSLTILNIGHQGTVLLCPDNDLASGVVQYSVNRQAEGGQQVSMYWMPLEEFHAMAAGGTLPKQQRHAFPQAVQLPEPFRSIPLDASQQAELTVLDGNVAFTIGNLPAGLAPEAAGRV
jgi:hypothetical protein